MYTLQDLFIFFLLGISPHAWGSHGIVHCQSIGLVSGRIGDPLSPFLRTTEDPCLGMGTRNKNKLYTPGMHVAVHIWQPRVTMGTKMGGLLLKKYTSIFYKACIPLGPFSKLDKQALWKRAKWCRLILHGSWWEYNWNDVLQLQVCHITWFLFPCIQRVDDGCQGAARLVVESVDKRQRIVSLTHDDGHFGVNRINVTIASIYYWPGYIDVKSYVRS